MRGLALAIALGVTSPCGCSARSSADSGGPSTASEPTGEAYVVFATPTGEVRVHIEVAEDAAALAQGLMYRRALAPDAGMLFVFPDEREHYFWMKNTYLALDMIFVDASSHVVGVVANAEPMTTTTRTVGVPSKYVIEVVAGYAAAHGITVGVAVRLEAIGP